jgi:4a-hydroxytetrahydrobiopterin dehydratase
MQITWETHANHLEAHIHFPDFKSCFAFASQVALLAEAMQHHPNFHIQYNHLILKLQTHDASNTITALDQKMAKAIEKMAAPLGFEPLAHQ